MKEKALTGCLLGTAVGDALGLPYEGMTGKRGGRMFPDRDRFHFLPGYGMVSDDTEHACFTAQAMIGAQGDPDRFERHIAWSLRWWRGASRSRRRSFVCGSAIASRSSGHGRR